MRSHEIDYRLIGDDMQVVEVELDPHETVIAEAGAMAWMDDGIGFEAKMGDGTETDSGFFGKVLGAGKRLITGESLFMTHFTNRGAGKKSVAFGAPYPGKIIPMDMAEHGNAITCQKDAFLCAAMGTKIDISFSRKIGRGLFGGEGFIMERLSGDGMAFLHAGGTVVQKELKGETIFVDTGCVVAYTDGIDFDIQKAGGLKSMIFGGEGIFLAVLKGHGTVYLQSLPFSRLADRILQAAPGGGGNDQGEGSVLGGLSNIFENR
ncbi:TIGR00266 family protein [Thiomicrorhabdus sp.]|uniref:TIGR00266 family protein n=1 Tax=Thiomicrorhabdus sp. TaxID=2039724 RepID=UPI0029C91598|nr:TIGR00266 family protein [Thiomicrorhabdus sp.]